MNHEPTQHQAGVMPLYGKLKTAALACFKTLTLQFPGTNQTYVNNTVRNCRPSGSGKNTEPHEQHDLTEPYVVNHLREKKTCHRGSSKP